MEIEGEDKRSSSEVVEVYGDHGKVAEGIRADRSSGLDEEAGCASGGSADDVISVKGIKENVTGKAIAEATAADDSLQLAKQLATEQKQGYRWEDGLILRERLDEWRENVSQLCVPRQFRRKCLNMVHTQFGHQGRNKMLSLLKPYFFWPKMARDCIERKNAVE